MKTIIKGVGYVLLAAIVWGVLAAPERTADTLVQAGQALGYAATKVGVAMAHIADSLPKKG